MLDLKGHSFDFYASLYCKLGAWSSIVMYINEAGMGDKMLNCIIGNEESRVLELHSYPALRSHLQLVLACDLFLYNHIQ